MFDVVCIGTATRDVFLKSAEFNKILKGEFKTGRGLCFNLGSKIEVDDIFFATGGGATNTAATFSNQGLKTAVVCKIGNDRGGKAIIEEMEKIFKVNVNFIQKDKEKNTAYSVILRCGEGRAGDRIILVYRGASEYLNIQQMPIKKIFNSKWVYFAPLGGENVNLFNFLVTEAVNHKVKIAIDLSKDQIQMGLDKLKPILKNINILKLNREEGSYLSGIDVYDIFGIAKELANMIKNLAIITDGPNGLVACDKEYFYQAGVYAEKRFIDRTGAGDAFGAGFVSSLILDEKNKKNWGIEKAIKFGTANATAVVEELGAKNGLLKKGDFEKDERWKNLEIKKTKV